MSLRSNLLILSLLAASASAGAAPSVYPTGVTRYDPALAHNQYVIFSGQDQKTHLIDMNGNEVQRWDAEGFPPVLLDPALTGGQRGHVLVQLASAAGTSNEGNGLRNQSIGELDWQGRVVWQWGSAGAAQDAYAAPVEGKSAQVPGGSAKQHHDWRRLANGNTLVLANLLHPVSGFTAPQVLDDVVYEVTPQGQIVWQWVAAEHLQEFGFSPASLKLVQGGHSPRGKAAPYDFLHVNNLSVLGPNRWFDAGDQRFHPDNLMIDAREANFIAIIDKHSGKVVWRLGPDYPAQLRIPQPLPRKVDQIAGQHDAHLIEPGLPGAGNLLVFDNQGEAGYPRVSVGVQPRSRVLEIDPVSQEIVWEYTGRDSNLPDWGFYSSFISSARRLPNGNTLIDEGTSGRIFQVTPKGDIAWEYISPYFAQTPVAGAGKAVRSNWVYRAQPVPYHWVPEGTPRSEQAVIPPEPASYRVAAH
ncbi:arylsulfotransferase family protein [Duganella qianjiadongensis]|uniref:ArsR family transcriptional regulator n=1 Tax=Duganella qianjiadongensis TaxID=2692176 RepID=A0ABW9VEX0_9BURK|nr:aryl-sulfate sulfotransferase [Duganella qianjiadongensis]MYM38149.1 ArsR family transcriptional regulator [Duganella qianjiadongensis]